LARITNNEQIALALQARLQRLKKQKKTSTNAVPNKIDSKNTEEMDALEEIVSNKNLNEDELMQRVVGKLLEDEFGADFAEDHRFLKITNRVSEILQKDKGSSVIFKKALMELRGEII